MNIISDDNDNTVGVEFIHNLEKVKEGYRLLDEFLTQGVFKKKREAVR
jgi:hypothetical protein